MAYVVVYGNPVDGLLFVGPFETAQEACDHGETFDDRDWWYTELEAPPVGETADLMERVGKAKAPDDDGWDD